MIAAPALESDQAEPIIGRFICAACQFPAERGWPGPQGELLCAVDSAARLNPAAFGLWLRHEERARRLAVRPKVPRVVLPDMRLTPAERGQRISEGHARRRARLKAMERR